MSTSVPSLLYSCPLSPLPWPGRVGSVGPNPGQWVRPALERLHWEVPKLVLTISAQPPYPRPNPGQPPTWVAKLRAAATATSRRARGCEDSGV
jgi:hypothetical protein